MYKKNRFFIFKKILNFFFGNEKEMRNILCEHICAIEPEKYRKKYIFVYRRTGAINLNLE